MYVKGWNSYYFFNKNCFIFLINVKLIQKLADLPIMCLCFFLVKMCLCFDYYGKNLHQFLDFELGEKLEKLSGREPHLQTPELS